MLSYSKEGAEMSSSQKDILRPNAGSVGKRRVFANAFDAHQKRYAIFPIVCEMCVPQLREIVPKTHNVNVCVHSVAQNCDKNKCYFKYR